MEPMINARCLRDGEKSAAHGFLPGTSGTAFGSYSQW
jgi:hypothetical protein